MATDRRYRVSLHLPDGTVRELSVDAHEHIWDAAHAAGIELPSICHQGRCLTCAARLLREGNFDCTDAVRYFPQDRAEGFILLCTCSPRSDLDLQTHQQKAMREHRERLGLPAPYSGVD
jgi:ferredoxin